MLIYVEVWLLGWTLKSRMKYFCDFSVESIYHFRFIKSSRCKVIRPKICLLFFFLLLFHVLQFLLMLPFVWIFNIFVFFERSIDNSSLWIGIEVSWLGFNSTILCSMPLWIQLRVFLINVLVSTVCTE
jgi:hypothetical protein